jgi:hypothetical protein
MMTYITACGPSAMEKAAAEHQKMTKDNILMRELPKNNTRIYTYQGCYYIVYDYPSDNTWGTHMGNCPNPIHKYVNVDSIQNGLN